MINSDKAISEMRAIGVPEADIKDLFTYRYNIDYVSTRAGRLYMMPDKCEMDLEVLAAGYPPSYLIGFVNFFGLKISVNNHVLIPRPETEELMTMIQEKHKRSLINSALDLCTGSGCIGLSLKKMFPKATVYASDISSYAIMQAQKNCEDNKEEMYLVISDYLDYFVRHKMKFDMIVSNPPYIKEDEILDNSLSYEPQEALFAGKDGLYSYRSIFIHLDEVMNEHGIAYFEIEASNAMDTLALANQILTKFHVELIKDLEGKDRFLKITRQY